jgi:molybdopterin synthase catalytic subunit
MANLVCELLSGNADLMAPDDWPDVSSGAVVDFWGVVRIREDEREIRGIDYEAHSAMAEHQLRLVGKEAIERYRLSLVVVRHRTGFVPVGKASLFARVAAPHRGEALQGMDWLIAELKKKVPIWKHPNFDVDESVGTGVDSQTGASRI